MLLRQSSKYFTKCWKHRKDFRYVYIWESRYVNFLKFLMFNVRFEMKDILNENVGIDRILLPVCKIQSLIQTHFKNEHKVFSLKEQLSDQPLLLRVHCFLGSTIPLENPVTPKQSISYSFFCITEPNQQQKHVQNIWTGILRVTLNYFFTFLNSCVQSLICQTWSIFFTFAESFLWYPTLVLLS